MKIAQLLSEGRRLPADKMQEDLRGLALDSRFVALVGWLDLNRENFIRAGSKQALAKEPGALAHCMGSVHAINLLEAQLANLLEPGGASGGQTPPPDNEL